MLKVKPTKESLVITKHDTVYKNSNLTSYKYGADIYHTDTVYLIDQIHDTAFIVKDYNEVKRYNDTLKLDQGFVAIYDTISRNAILGRGYYSHLVEKTITTKEIIQTKPKAALYWGVLASYEPLSKKYGYGIGLQFKTAKRGIYSLNLLSNQFQAGYYAKF